MRSLGLGLLFVLLTAGSSVAQLGGAGVIPGNAPWRGGFVSSTIAPLTDNATDLGVTGTNRFRNVYAVAYYGSGVNLTGIAGATGGVSNTGSTTVASDSDNAGAEDIAFYTSTVARWFVKGGTGHVLPNVGNTYDIGASATTIRAVYAQQFSAGSAALANTIYSGQLLAGQKVLGSSQISGETSGVSIIDLATTWNNAANTPTAIKLNVLDSASNANSLLLNLQVGGVNKFVVYKSGIVQSAGPSIATYFSTATATIQSTVSGVIKVTNETDNDFTRLQFGGTTNQFPALGRNGTNLAALLGDGSDYTYFITYGIQLGSFGSIKMVGVDGIIGLFNNAGTSFNRLVFGGTTDSFPALLRDTTDLSIVGGAAGVVNSSLIIPGQKATSGQRYVCITTTGRLVSSAAACSGT